MRSQVAVVLFLLGSGTAAESAAAPARPTAPAFSASVAEPLGLEPLELSPLEPSPLPASPLAPRLLAGDTMARLQEAAAAEPSESGSRHGRLSDVGRSLVLPGWGQLHAGYRTLGFAFLATEAVIWTAFAVNTAKGEMRKDSYEETARLYAGIDLNAVDEEFRALIGQYYSSDEYNRLVVYRDAAALYYGDFENYDRYIEENSLSGSETWSWGTEADIMRYGSQRRSSENAFHDAQFVAALAIVNRVASAIVAARLAPRTPEPSGEARGLSSHPTWGFVPGPTGELEPRLAWELRFH